VLELTYQTLKHFHSKQQKEKNDPQNSQNSYERRRETNMIGKESILPNETLRQNIKKIMLPLNKK